MSLLENVNSPKDLKKLNIKQLNQLCAEIRNLLISTVSHNGGHLSSNLGVVELTVALHKVFNSPTDQIVFDVGHQCYTHKILTGRKDEFSTLRTENGISGFTRPDESVHDIFSSGHSSTSISEAVGLANAKKIKGEKGKVIAVIGDGALTGGLAYEALNNCGFDNSNLIVILNDNEMSISKNVGSVAHSLTEIRTSPRYFTFKSKFRSAILHIPKIGNELNRIITAISSKIRRQVYHSTFFEDLGFRYYGVIDGHDIEALIDVLNAAKTHTHSTLIHISTTKGKGYNFAEKNPTQFHGIGQFDINTGEPKHSGQTFSSVFGEWICSSAKNDSRICAVTAAMAQGTGLEEFSNIFPNRFFDVGIAEQHAVTFSSGLAKNSLVPVFAVYSTFLQRSYDQLIHDTAMQNLKIIFAVDRAGFVGEDGESHQGVFDVCYLNSVPGLTVYSPSTFEELQNELYKAVYKDRGAVAVRYPRGSERVLPEDYVYEDCDYQVYGDDSGEIALVSYGRVFCECARASKKINNCFVLKLNKIKPINKDSLKHLNNCRKIYFFEEAIKTGGIGQSFAEALLEEGISCEFVHVAVNDEFVKQASVESQLNKYGLSEQEIINEVLNGEKEKA